MKIKKYNEDNGEILDEYIRMNNILQIEKIMILKY